MAENKVGLAHALGTAAGSAINEIGAGAGCQELHWELWPFVSDDSTPYLLLAGQVDASVSTGDVPDVAAAWVRLFGLDESLSPPAGTVEYRGVVEGIRVSVSGIVDRDAAEGRPA